MKIFKKGDIVKIHDGSYSQTITEEGRIEDTHGRQLTDRKFEVIATGCDLPGKTYTAMSNERNNTILRALDNNQIIFIQSRMFTLAHRCDCCPNCGKEI